MRIFFPTAVRILIAILMVFAFTVCSDGDADEGGGVAAGTETGAAVTVSNIRGIGRQLLVLLLLWL